MTDTASSPWSAGETLEKTDIEERSNESFPKAEALANAIWKLVLEEKDNPDAGPVVGYALELVICGFDQACPNFRNSMIYMLSNPD